MTLLTIATFTAMIGCNSAAEKKAEENTTPSFNAVNNTEDTIAKDTIRTDTLPKLNAMAIKDSIKKARMKALKK